MLNKKIFFNFFLLASLVFVVSGCSSTQNNIQENQIDNKQIEEPKSQEVSLIIRSGDKEGKYEKEFRDNMTAFDILQEVSNNNDINLDYSESDFGVFVNSIGNIKNDSQNSMFWMYKVNGQSAEVGASSYKLNVSDVVEWEYIDVSNSF